MSEINLIGGFYKSKTLPWSAQDVVNWLPVKSLSGGTRSPYKLRGAPGLAGMNPPVTVQQPLVRWRVSNTGTAVTSFNVPIPEGAQAGDQLVIYACAVALGGPPGFYTPTSDAFETLIGGFGDVFSGKHQVYTVTATASHVSSGVPMDIQGLGTITPQKGLFIVYSVTPTIIDSVIPVDTAGSFRNSAVLLGDPTTTPTFPTDFLSATTVAFAHTFLPSSGTIATYPYSYGNVDATLDSARMATCYHIGPRPLTFPATEWAYATNPSSGILVVGVNAFKGIP